ncbi:serine protease [Paractinoplanes atraurantiacus]|uniref:Trypsin-like peptidase domain-containing protein n=1 Tax=Paractinoplanes atraurantiacus TaxID=1036182 RepID=A0A285IB01_9ACTN|nr:serine protease [Actinoplanes atraurantiacus]SNY45148.1 Trypsin-like peptidase domain-containing protein [Actinoplanes atraurantiacus]
MDVADRRLISLLGRAYPSREAMLALARAAGPAVDAQDDWPSLLRRARDGGRYAALLADVLYDPASSQFHQPLLGLLGADRDAVLAAGLVRHGLPADPGTRQALLESLSTAPDPGLQANLAPPAGINDPMTYANAVADAVRRVARIEVDGRPAGTGMLVGPDLVLTAAHVLDASAFPPPGSPSVVAVFDFVRTPGASESETGTRVPVAEFLCGSLPSAQEAAGTAANNDPGPDRLDFALLRLSSPPPAAVTAAGPAERGHYRLDPAEYAFASAPLLFIVQHPLGAFQGMTFLTQRPAVLFGGRRISYLGNTAPGSSGSPVLDISGRLVALHHYAATGSNRGVPIAPIAAALLANGFGELFGTGGGPAAPVRPGTDPFRVTRIARQPYVDRNRLRGTIAELCSGDSPILVVSGQRRTGVSYTYRLLAYGASRWDTHPPLRTLVPGGLAVVPLDLRQYAETDPGQRLDRLIPHVAQLLGLHRAGEQFAQEARNVVSLGLWIRSGLRGSAKQWWIFVDGVDDPAESCPGPVAELISEMLRLADDPQVPLRVVLGGAGAAEVAETVFPVGTFALDTVNGLSRADVQAWLRDRVAEEGGAADDARLGAELDKLYPADAPLPIDLIAASLPAIVQRLTPGQTP